MIPDGSYRLSIPYLRFITMRADMSKFIIVLSSVFVLFSLNAGPDGVPPMNYSSIGKSTTTTTNSGPVASSSSSNNGGGNSAGQGGK
jgi:hypothetical protein